MKKISFLSLLFVVIMVSCGPKPEEQVKDFALKFGDFVNTNQKDSIQKYYPEFELIDSLTNLSVGNITVMPTETEGIFVVEYPPETSLTVNIDKGEIEVLESMGLFEYPEKKIEIAKKTGMWDEDLSDVEMAARMNNEDFFEYLKKAKTIKTSDILSMGKERFTDYDVIYPIINKTDIDLDGSEYQIIIEEAYPVFGEPGNYESTVYKVPGKAIKAHGTYNYKTDLAYGGLGGEHVKGFVFNMTPEQLEEKFGSYSGNEYREYLNSIE